MYIGTPRAGTLIQKVSIKKKTPLPTDHIVSALIIGRVLLFNDDIIIFTNQYIIILI